ncbi:MAG TPA: hypothetical protein VEF04_08615 [Blastocatellia bacterium]|nr:hypothetical protein [Blastocatellia bacterium]
MSLKAGARQLLVQRAAVIGLFADQSLRERVNEAFDKRIGDQGDSCGAADVFDLSSNKDLGKKTGSRDEAKK